jgi:hypothetical protein
MEGVDVSSTCGNKNLHTQYKILTKLLGSAIRIPLFVGLSLYIKNKNKRKNYLKKITKKERQQTQFTAQNGSKKVRPQIQSVV